MSDASSPPGPTPTNYQRTTGGHHLRWQPPTPERLQEMLPTYEILSVLGQGGMGAVYKGRQKSLDRVVAIKILPPEAAEDDMQFAERFKNEARTMAKMNHPAIVHVYDFGETTEGQLYIVMEFIDGTDVAQMIQSQGKLPEDYALSITAHVCDALGYAHTQGIVHRDIKPANILINMAGQVKVADFGLAKATDPSQMGLTKTNMAMGTPDFVSPEALMPGVPLDGRADLYAVGVMLYNMLTGTIPRGAFRMPGATLQTDARFDQIIQKAMEMDRENRYQTALDLRRDLDVILTTPAAKSGVQTIPAQAALPQKPMGKSPGAPQQRSADAPIRKVPAAKPARAPVQAPKKSNAAMIYGIAAAVAVIAVAIFLFAGGEKKPAAAPKAVAETKPEPKPTESKPAPAPAAVAAGKEQWVNGLAQWFGATKTNEDFVRENNGAARIGSASAILSPIPRSARAFRDQVARVRWHPSDAKSLLEVHLRRALPASAADSDEGFAYRARLHQSESLSMRFGCRVAGKPYYEFQVQELPADFKVDATHTLEFRVVGDLLTVSMDGKKVGEHRDSLHAGGHPAITAKNVIIESFEYANLDPGGAAPALVSANPAPASPLATAAPPTKPVDLLALVDVKRDTSKREWAAAPGSVISKMGDTFPILEIQQTPPAEYDFEIEFTIAEGLCEVSQVLAVPGGNVFWQMGYSGTGDQTIFCFGPYLDEKKPDTGTGAALKRARLKSGQRYRSLVEVRKDSLRALIDGVEVLKWTGDFKRFGNPADYCNFKSTTHLGLASYKSEVTFHKAELRPVTPRSGAIPGAVTPPPASSAPAVSPTMPAVASASTAPSTPAAGMSPLLGSDPRLAQLAAGFKARHEADALQPFNTALASLNTSYLANGVSRARTAAQAKGSLAEVTALDAEKTAIEQGRAVPDEDEAGTPDSLKTLRGTYRTAHAKFAAERDAKAAPLYDLYLRALDAYIAELTQADKIDVARKVQAFRDDLALQKLGAAAIPKLKDGITNSLGMKFLPVPNTEVLFCIHETRYKDYAAYAADAQGVDGSWKNQTYDGYANTERNEDHPVAQVSWEDAQAFCAWLSKKEGKTYRLPTDEEWSVAVGLGRAEKRPKGTTPAMLNQQETTEFPWGTNWPPPKGSGNFSDESRKAKAPNGSAGYLDGYDDGFPTTAPVMSFKPNKLGLYDLGGNVWEWCEDWNDNAQKDRVMRGASWNEHERRYPLSSYRHGTPSRRRNLSGFRCVLVPSGSVPAAATSPAVSSPSAPSTAAKPAVRAPKMNEHELAEWAIATGGHVDVTFGTPEVKRTIAIATELPSGRFTIHQLNVVCEKTPGKDLSPLASANDATHLILQSTLLPDKTYIDLAPLRQMPKLRVLKTEDLDAAGVDAIASLTEITSIIARNMPEGSLEKIAKLKQLGAFDSPAIVGPGIAALKNCKNLRNIVIGSNPGASDEDVRALATALPDLDYLAIGGPALTNACIPSLLSLKSLKTLQLQNNEFDDSVIEPLGKLPNLAQLRLFSSKIVGSKLEVLKKFSSLRDLYLDGCSITDEALDVLVQIKGLTKLQLRNTKVTDAGIAKFKAARPGFNISK